MMQFDKIKQFLGFNQDISKNLRDTFSSITELFFNDGEKKFRAAFQSLVYPLLTENNAFKENAKIIYGKLLEEYFDVHTAETYLNEISGLEPLSIDSAAEIIANNGENSALKTAEFLIALAISLGCKKNDISFTRQAASFLGMSAGEFSERLRLMLESEKRKQRLRNSSRGILSALIIVFIFILTAKFLQSVIFGVLLACILLPVEKFFERRLRKKHGLLSGIVRFFYALFYPLKKLSSLVTKKEYISGINQADKDATKEHAIIKQAVIFTCITALIISIATAFGVSKLTGHYMRNLQQSIRLWEKDRIKTGSSKNPAPMSRYEFALETLKENFESIPIVQTGLDYISKFINKPDVRNQLTRSIMRSSGGIINLTGGVLGWFVSICCDVLLTIFFALLFLIKFAEFSSSNKKGKYKSEYIVRNFFNGIWLPGADENLIEDTCKIIDGIIYRLQVWLKGYITLILVDSTFYTTCFFFIGVPFFLPLGIIAGCGIALPYLGPVISCLLTLLVSIAAGGAYAEMLMAIIICYLVYNGIIEQFILYPAVIGESLGLSTLETIVVVLLGAVFAGIPGMIFALPTASVAKYIIPQIYHGFSLPPPMNKRF